MNSGQDEIEWGATGTVTAPRTLFPQADAFAEDEDPDAEEMLQALEVRYRIPSQYVRVLVAFSMGASIGEALAENNVSQQEYYMSMMVHPVHKEAMLVASEIRGMGLMVRATEMAEQLSGIDTPTPGDRMRVQLLNHMIRLGEIWGSRLFSRDVQKKRKAGNLLAANLAHASTGTRARDEAKEAEPEKEGGDAMLQLPDGVEIRSGGRRITEVPAR